MKLLIRGGRVIDPAAGTDHIGDILVQDGRFASVGQQLKGDADSVIDADGCICMPGIIDMHVHLREPGREDKETVATGTRAALKGGITACLAMPNTFPAIDSPEMARLLSGIISRTSQTQVLIAAAITKGRLGRELTDAAGLKEEGAVALTDDGSSVDSEELMGQALAAAKKAGVVVICHCEDRVLSRNGVVNLGLTSTRLGLRGISRESEYRRVERDILLAERAGASVHIAHVSCKESVEIIAAAKRRGVRVTAETAPHYFALSEEAVLGYDTNMKMNPPLRSSADTEALRQGLADGTIDVIASDHAPHTESEKEVEFVRAEFGVIGLETLLSVSATELVAKGVLDWVGLARKLSLHPARILGTGGGTLAVGAAADMVVFAPEEEWVVEKKSILSKAKNSAFLNRRLQGVVRYTIRNGAVVYTLTA